jgi:hypothetical protein
VRIRRCSPSSGAGPNLRGPAALGRGEDLGEASRWVDVRCLRFVWARDDHRHGKDLVVVGSGVGNRHLNVGSVGPLSVWMSYLRGAPATKPAEVKPLRAGGRPRRGLGTRGFDFFPNTQFAHCAPVQSWLGANPQMIRSDLALFVAAGPDQLKPNNDLNAVLAPGQRVGLLENQLPGQIACG